MIQRIIHQIFIGPNALPEREAVWCLQMKETNWTWKYSLRGNDLLEQYGRDPYVKALVDVGDKWAFVADRLRVLLLRDEGGIYLDNDCQPIRPLDTLKLWDGASLDFVYGTRPTFREGVAIKRGVAFCDNTVMASAKNGRTINRVADLWKPETPRVTGHVVGCCLLDNANETCVSVGYRPFYDMRAGPETIVLHDCHNSGSWVDPAEKKRIAIEAGFHHVAHA